MKFILKVDDNDMFRSADIRDLNAVETLVINSALRRESGRRLTWAHTK